MITLVDTLMRSIPKEKRAPKIFDILILSMLLLSHLGVILAAFNSI